MLDIIMMSVLMMLIFYRSEVDIMHEHTAVDHLLAQEVSTALKGLSAFFVIAAHIHAWIKEIVNITPYNRFTDLFLTQLGGIGVLIFFFISGYGIQEGYGRKAVDASYVIKRIKNVWLPYVELKTAFLIIELITGTTTMHDIPESILGILTLEDWFIFVIVMEYIFYYMARKLTVGKFFFLLCAFNIAMAVVFIIQQRADRYVNSMWLFLLGVVVSIYKTRFFELFRSSFFASLGIGILIFFMAGVLFTIFKGALWADIFKPVSGMALCVALICITQKVRLGSPFLKYGGQRSLYLYIVHIWVFGWLSAFIDSIYILLLAFIIVTLIIVELFYRRREICTWVLHQFKS